MSWLSKTLSMDFLEWVIWLVFLKLYLVGIFLSESFWKVVQDLERIVSWQVGFKGKTWNFLSYKPVSNGPFLPVCPFLSSRTLSPFLHSLDAVVRVRERPALGWKGTSNNL